MGGFQGDLSPLSAPELGASAIKAALTRSALDADQVNEVIMGCVLPAGQGQAPARQASIGAGIPLATGCTTINKMCGSGMKAAMFAHDLLRAGTNDVMVAGGMESMTNAPYLLHRARDGYRMGHGQVLDHMFLDGLEDAYDKGRLMGTFAEDTAEHYQFTREAQDDFAIRSLKRAQRATEDGSFANEITPVGVRCAAPRRKSPLTNNRVKPTSTRFLACVPRFVRTVPSLLPTRVQSRWRSRAGHDERVRSCAPRYSAAGAHRWAYNMRRNPRGSRPPRYTRSRSCMSAPVGRRRC